MKTLRLLIIGAVVGFVIAKLLMREMSKADRERLAAYEQNQVFVDAELEALEAYRKAERNEDDYVIDFMKRREIENAQLRSKEQKRRDTRSIGRIDWNKGDTKDE